MVFGWGKKKKEEQKPSEIPLEKKEVPLSEVSKIIYDLNELRKSQAVSEIKHLRNNTEPLIEDLIKIGNVLEKDNLNVDDIDKHLAIIVVRGKKQVIDVIKKTVTNLPEVSSLDDANKLNKSLSNILKLVGDVLGRQTRVIHIFAKKYASQLKENLEVMTHNHSEIQKILKNYDSTHIQYDEILEIINTIKDLKETKTEKIQKINEIQQNIASVDEKISEIKHSIEKIKSSGSYSKYLDLQKKLSDTKSLKTQIKNSIDSQFTKISRPLSRYEYASSMDKEQKLLLTKLVKNPFDVLLPQFKDSIILILENVRKGISSGSISVKDSDKSLVQLTEIEEALDGFIIQVSDYNKTYDQIHNELLSLESQELKTLESDLSKNITLQEDFQLKLETFQGEIDDINSKIPTLISNVEQKLQTFSNTKYAILPS